MADSPPDETWSTDLADAPTIHLADSPKRTATGETRAARGGRFGPGQRLGAYTIRGLLGAGGMGEVYDCEDADSGRRVALKTLSVTLADAESRARFMREGRLAAALSHPNTVYIFGSDEIDGIPVIAMELMAGGTLADLVARRGPLPAADAVASIRQIIAGLSYAATAGILHRDIKPANCFVDSASLVKVGDFGLSVSTKTSETLVTLGMSTMGTPAFASPEQMRGDTLDVRSDIYSVGATLFHLLTGQPPFTGTNLMRLLSQVAAEAPPDVRTLQPAVPEGVARVVARCLAKNPADRFGDYQALDAALQPYASPAVAAGLVPRFSAFVVDQFVVSIAVLLVMQLVGLPETPWDPLSLSLNFLFASAYFGVVEGRFGAGLGKMALGLRVVRDSGEALGIARAGGRAALVMGAINLVAALFGGTAHGAGWSDWATSMMSSLGGMVGGIAIFSTARPSNRFRAWHDRWTGSFVTQAIDRAVTVLAGRPATQPSRAVSSRVGPFGLVDQPDRLPDGIRLGLDERLRRHVWIRLVPTGTPPVSTVRRDLSRTTRPRWLGGQRGGEDGHDWDAYEAFDGEPLADTCRHPHSWGVVRRWLSQLSEEFYAAALDGTGGDRQVSDLWITRSQDLKVLDFGEASGAPDDDRERRLLLRCAAMGLGVSVNADGPPAVPAVPIPLGANEFLTSVCEGRESRASTAEGLRALAMGPPAVTFTRRAGQLAIVIGFLAFLAAAMWAGALAFEEAGDTDARMYGRRLTAIRRGAPVVIQGEVQYLQVLIAGHLDRSVRANSERPSPMMSGIVASQRRRLEPLVQATAVPDDATFRDAEQKLLPLRTEPERFGLRRRAQRSTIVSMLVAVVWGGVGILAVLVALLFRTGVSLRAASMAVAVMDGRPASRARILARTIAAWSPIFVAAGSLGAYQAWAAVDPGWPMYTMVAACLAVLAAGVVAALRSPDRGWQDRVAGTRLVPR